MKHRQYQEISKEKRKKFEREANYEVVKEQVSEWQPQVKRQREAEQVDFRTTQDTSTQNFYQKTRLDREKNEITKVLDKNKLFSEQGLKERLEEKIGEENKEKIFNELMKQKHLMLYQEQKAKRIKKIKSKIYRKIKRKKEERIKNEAFKNQLSDKTFALEELEKIERQRALERASLRHKNKSQFTK